MTAIRLFWGSTIGKKVVMAVTGLMLVGFIISHVLANLLVFRGPEAINAYGALLRANMPLLWVARLGLIAAFVFHILAAVQLTRIDARARPVGYKKWQPNASTFASRTIRWGGLFLLIFVILHILHFTTGHIHPWFIEGDIYHNVTVGFRSILMVVLYVAAMIAIGLHLYHGVWAAIRSLGLNRASANPLHRRVSTLLGVGVALGFVVIPLAVFAGFLR